MFCCKNLKIMAERVGAAPKCRSIQRFSRPCLLLSKFTLHCLAALLIWHAFAICQVKNVKIWWRCRRISLLFLSSVNHAESSHACRLLFLADDDLNSFGVVPRPLELAVVAIRLWRFFLAGQVLSVLRVLQYRTCVYTSPLIRIVDFSVGATQS